jgi:class 3 adenylate cyclase
LPLLVTAEVLKVPFDQTEIAILVADVAGSTPLYESVGDQAAARQIGDCLARMTSIAEQHDGRLVLSKGDDVLCAFAEPVAAFTAAKRIVASPLPMSLSVHAGLNFGNVVHRDGDIFGDAVNLTARLASIAKAREVLISESLVDRLPSQHRSDLNLLDSIKVVGKSVPTTIYSHIEDDSAAVTQVVTGSGQGLDNRKPDNHVKFILRHGTRALTCHEDQRILIGRSSDCDLVIALPWISRRHATITVRSGRMQLEDQSTSGTYVRVDGRREFFIRRETVLLAGSGMLSPVLEPADSNAEHIFFEA